MREDAESLIAYCRAEGRVCPMPSQWDRFWRRHFKEEELRRAPNLSGPLILAAWSCDNETKMDCLANQIRWAEKLGILEEVSSYLRGLEKKDWYFRKMQSDVPA